MQIRRITALASGATGALVAGTGFVRAQQNSGGVIDLGGSIESTVSDAVASISTGSGGTVAGGSQVEHNEISLGEQQGLAIADASGGNNNVSFVS